MNETAPPWVFGYGSLIWRPGFAFEMAERALLRGAHRRLCILSHRHRGTPERPGLVFGLERGGSCLGMAFKVRPDHWRDVREYLREREQVTGVYKEALRNVRLASGATVQALVFLADQSHSQYAGRLSLDQQLELVAGARGESGDNRDYVINTAAHLAQIGIIDRPIVELSSRLQAKKPALES
ncbi:gamma-glutamylcyclotransferase [Pelagibacterium lentulum]|uniref:glutathione-specific gamma-glutamylcyclotransferase n=1 Tax=Pelagibacterium lentulum TaxID=2029865 RepID=A0A916R3N4_9HYPH|nr:gamma-glutamylcyclotransferase [Pelagibacterium lentulum]GGA35259.1 gamma-glutamylcyclotransferase [Pelagibacterium lentulum]